MKFNAELFADDGARLRHRILEVLDQQAMEHRNEPDVRFQFLDVEALSIQTERPADEVMGHIFVLHEEGYIEPHSFGDGVDVYALNPAGKAVMVKRELLESSGERRAQFLKNWMAVAISLVALAVSVITFVRSFMAT